MIEVWFSWITETADVQTAILPLLAVAAVAAAAGAVGGAVTRNKQKKALNRISSGVEKEQAENKTWYNANALADYTQRADTQNLFKNLRDNLKKNRDATSATAAVTGATPAAIAAAKERDAKAISDTYSNVAATGQQWKDNITGEYLRRKDYLNSRKLGIDGQRLADYDRQAQNWGNLMYSGINYAAGAAASGTTQAGLGVNNLKAGTYGKYY
jgi:hypothetical protein